MTLSTRQDPLAEAPGSAPARTPPVPASTVEPAPGGNTTLLRWASGRVPHHPAGLAALGAGGNRAVARLAAPVQPKLTVSRPGDPLERQADAVARQVTAGEPAAAGPVAGIARLAQPAADAGEPPGGPQLPPGLEQLIAAPGAGAPLPPEIGDRLEQHLGFPMAGVRVHSDPAAQLAAAQLGARAFTTGRDIFLGAGESATDLALMAHEATHVVQQQAVGVYRRPVQRDAAGFLLGSISGLVSAVPGYSMLTVVAGYDPIANRTVDRSPENLARGVLGLVPFGTVVAGKLIELGVLPAAARMLDDGLKAHNLTLQRIQAEIDQAWKEIDLTDLDGALVIVRRHVAGLYADALGFVRGVLDAIVQLIRDTAVGLAEKYLVGTPSWELVKKVLHQDPLRGTPVAATTVEILTDFLTLIGKADAVKQMQERGTLQKTADWLDTKITQFLGLLGELSALFEAGWAAIQPENLARLPETLSALAQRAVGLIGRVGAFAGEVLTEVVRLIKDALLEWLSREAAGMRGFRLMTVLLGQDPFTGKAVPRTAENLIGGFIALLPGGEATYRKLAEAGVVADAAAKIEGAIARLGITPELIIGTFRGIWDSLTLADLVDPVGAFVRVLEKFGEPLARIVAFAGEVLEVVVTLILKLMNFPAEVLGSIIDNAMAAIEDIKKDPVAFLLNMLQALKQGFLGFIDRALTYLLTGLADWMFRGLGALGIQKPPDLTFGSILTMVLQVLDITAEKLWKKLGDQIGAPVVEKIRKGLAVAEGAFDFIKDVQEGGVGAIWKHVESQLGNLWDTVLGMVKDWIVREIVEKATVKLLSMLDPTGIMAVVNSSIAFFKAVQSVIEYVRELLIIVNDYVTTLAAVAAGNIQAGAQKVEKGLASAVPVAIGFLANQVGLGNVPEKLVEIIGEARVVVDEALDWLFKKAVDLAKAALQALGLGGAPEEKHADPEHDVKVKAGLADLPQVEQQYMVNGKITHENAEKVAATVRSAHPIFTKLAVVDGGSSWNYAWAASAGDIENTPAEKAEGPGTLPQERYLPAKYREKNVIRRRLYETGSGWKNLSRLYREHMIHELEVTTDVLVGGTGVAGIEQQFSQWAASSYIPRVVVDEFSAAYNNPDRTKNQPRSSLRGTWMTDRLKAHGVRWHTDHIEPLAQHWVNVGYNAAEDVRIQHASNIGKLGWMTSVDNLSKGSRVDDENGETESFHYVDKLWVGPAFTSRRAENNAVGARTIDDVPFVGPDGKPLTW